MRFDSKSPSLAGSGVRLLALAVFSLLLAACSTIKLGYNNADTLLLHSLDRYVSLTDDQQAMVRERVGGLMAWHRATQLADYADFIQRARGSLNGHVTAADILEFNAGLNARLGLLGERAAPDAAALALSLGPKQIDELERELIDENVKARKESEKERRKAIDERAKKYAERAEFWLGKVSDEQARLIRASLARRAADSVYWLEARERRTRALVDLVRRIHTERPAEEVATRWFRAYFRELAWPADPQQRARADAFRRDSAELVAQLLNSATPAQRAHLDRRLSGFAAEFVQLAERAGSG